MSEHTTPYEALLYLLEGKAEVIIQEKQHILLSGEVIFLPPSQPHAVKAVQRLKMLLIMLRG
ncbi:MAG: cupin domain-containing protein [Chloroflexota bacterium]